VASVWGKIGRAESATDPAPLTMVETTVRLNPPSTWRKISAPRWYSRWAPGWLARGLGRIWPERRPMNVEELTRDLDEHLRLPGWTNAWTLPIKTRVDMLSTGVRTPVGVKIFGTDLAEIERVGTTLERVLTGVPGTRSVLYERNLGGLYVDIIPRPAELARYGLRVSDIQQVVESAIGGTPIGVTIEGRNRFTINVRYPQDVRGDVDKLRLLPVPLGPAAPPGTEGALPGPRRYLAQAMSPDMTPAQSQRKLREAPVSDAMPPSMDVEMPRANGMTSGDARITAPGMRARPAGVARSVPLGDLADVRITAGPPMVRDEAGLLVGYVYVDIDESARDLGGYVTDAKAAVAGALGRGELKLPAGSYLKWTGQYEQLAVMAARMKIVIPLTLAIIVALLAWHFRSAARVLIVLLSIPFAAVGSVWLLWLLDYRLSTAVWVGLIALSGLAAQTGIVMIVYIDHAFERRVRAGEMRGLPDIIEAVMEGTVQRVRPKLMTVATMLIGLLPLLWATTTGADVMKRIAAPMVGGLLTSAFLTLELIPVVYTYWRLEELLWQRLGERRRALQAAAIGVAGAAALLAGAAVAPVYLAVPTAALRVAAIAGGAGLLLAATLYVLRRRALADSLPVAAHFAQPPEPNVTP
jgi:Cu(I)/Ag(I) efflux system membrane protein CusA/SilA